MQDEEEQKSNYLIIKHQQILINIQTLVCLNIFDRFSFTNNSLHSKRDTLIDNQCLSIKPDQYLYFNQSTLCADLTLTNECQHRIIQFKLMCTRNYGISVW